MRKLTMLSFILLVLGLSFTGYGGYKIVQMKLKQSETLTEAKQIVSENIGEEKPAKSKRFRPSLGETVGILKIPKIKAELPIVEGTDPDELEKGVGHYRGSFYPDENGQIILSGHRDTVFRQAGELEIGDILEMSTPYGTYTYKIIGTKIVQADDETIITLQNQTEELIVTTCYPFSYIGNAPERYIIYAEPTF